MTLDYGVIEIDDSWKLAPEEVDFSVDLDVDINNYPMDVTIGFSFGTTGRKVRLMNTRFKTLSDVQTFLGNIKTLHEAGAPYKLEWKVESTPTYFSFDGSTAYMYVFCTKIQGLIQESKGFQTIFKIRLIEFREAQKT